MSKDWAARFCQYSNRIHSDKLCVELKSLKIYFVSFRDKPGFHEDLTNQILDDLVKLLDPIFININAEWNVRGGIYTSVNVTHEKGK